MYVFHYSLTLFFSFWSSQIPLNATAIWLGWYETTGTCCPSSTEPSVQTRRVSSNLILADLAIAFYRSKPVNSKVFDIKRRKKKKKEKPNVLTLYSVSFRGVISCDLVWKKKLDVPDRLFNDDLKWTNIIFCAKN